MQQQKITNNQPQLQFYQNVRMPPNVRAPNIDDDNGGEVGISSGATKFIALEDYFIAKAWVKTTTDPRLGTSQSGNTFYQTMHNHYIDWVRNANQNRRASDRLLSVSRSLVAIKQQWFIMQRAVNKILAVWYAIQKIWQRPCTMARAVDAYICKGA